MPPVTIIPWKEFHRPEVIPMLLRRLSSTSESRGDTPFKKDEGKLNDEGGASYGSASEPALNFLKNTNDFTDLHSMQRIVKTTTVKELEITRQNLLKRPIVLRAVIVRDIGISRRMSIKDVALASARRARSRSSFAGVDNKVREDFAVLLDTNDPAVRRELNCSVRKARDAMQAEREFCVDIDLNQDVADWFDEHIAKSSPFHQFNSPTICKGAKLYLTNVTLSAQQSDNGGKGNGLSFLSGCCGFFSQSTTQEATIKTTDEATPWPRKPLLSDDFAPGSPLPSGSCSILEDDADCNTATIKFRLESSS